MRTFFQQFKIHIIGFTVTVILVVVYSFYQLFVDSQFEFYFKPINFVTKSGREKISRALKKPTQEDPLRNGYVFVVNNSLNFKKREKEVSLRDLSEVKLMGMEVSPDGNKLAVLMLGEGEVYMLEIFTLDNGARRARFYLGKIEVANLINWGIEGDRVYVALKNIEWKVEALNIEGGRKEIINGIHFDRRNLSYSLWPIEKKIVVPNCQEKCDLLVVNIDDTSLIKNETIRLDDDGEGLKMEFYFFDEKNDRIGYLSDGGDNYLVIDFKGYLWHRLAIGQGNERPIDYKGFQVMEKKLNLIAYSGKRKEAYIYDLLDYGLKIVELEEGLVPIRQKNNFNNFLLLRDELNNEWLKLDLTTQEKKLIGEGWDLWKVI